MIYCILAWDFWIGAGKADTFPIQCHSLFITKLHVQTFSHSTYQMKETQNIHVHCLSASLMIYTWICVLAQLHECNVMILCCTSSKLLCWPMSHEKSHASNLIGSSESWTVKSTNPRNCSKGARTHEMLMATDSDVDRDSEAWKASSLLLLVCNYWTRRPLTSGVARLSSSASNPHTSAPTPCMSA